MKIEQLDLKTRSRLYSFTKNLLRKYQKGIASGKLTADKFSENILSDENIRELIDENILIKDEFVSSYTNYIDTLISHQKKSMSNSKKKHVIEKPTITQKLELNKLLETTNYTLNIPFEYLNSQDVKYVTEYINTGIIDLGNEKIYNYVSKNNFQ